MGKREKYERRLLRAAAKGSLKRVLRMLPELDESSTDSESSHASPASDGSLSEPESDGGEEGGRPRDSLSRKRQVAGGRERDSREKGRVEGKSRKRQKESRRRQTEHRKKKRRRERCGRIDVNCHDAQGWTPLHHAAFAGTAEVVTLLVSRGASVTAGDLQGRTAAHVAARQGHVHVVSLLAELGAELAQPDGNGKTAHDILAVRLEALRERIFARSQQAHETEYVEPPDWSERLWGNLSDDDGGAGGGGWEDGGGAGFRREAAELGVAEDMWRDEIAKAMERKRREKEEAARKAAQEAAEAAWGRRARGPWRLEDEQKRREAEEERSQESRRILEEEQAKDRAWRERVQEGKVVQQQSRYLERWSTFAASCNLGLGLADVPFPVEAGKEGDLGKVLLLGVPPAEQRKRIREEVLKWHPDKFVQRWGLRLDPAERDKVLTRVKEISQQVQETYASLPKDAG